MIDILPLTVEWKLFLEDGADSCSFKKNKTLFHFSPPPTKQTMSGLGSILGTADGSALPSVWELNNHFWKSPSVFVRKQQCKELKYRQASIPCVSYLNLKLVGLSSSDRKKTLWLLQWKTCCKLYGLWSEDLPLLLLGKAVAVQYDWRGWSSTEQKWLYECGWWWQNL